MGILHIGHSLLRVNYKSNIFLDNNIMGIRKTRKKRGGGPNQTVSKSQSLQTIGEERGHIVGAIFARRQADGVNHHEVDVCAFRTRAVVG